MEMLNFICACPPFFIGRSPAEKAGSGFSFQTFFAEKAQKGFPLQSLTQIELQF
jgi:hypothetical protein